MGVHLRSYIRNNKKFQCMLIERIWDGGDQPMIKIIKHISVYKGLGIIFAPNCIFIPDRNW